MAALALALALLLDSALARAKRFIQLALFIPHAVPGIIAALIWMYRYTPGISPDPDLLETAGTRPDLLGNPLPAVVTMALWQWTGYNVVIFYAALQAIPRDVLEAAVGDGAGRGPHRDQAIRCRGSAPPSPWSARSPSSDRSNCSPSR
ncbi:hypothetical protein SCALM49S_04339 [Streptomyces californicus]